MLARVDFVERVSVDADRRGAALGRRNSGAGADGKGEQGRDQSVPLLAQRLEPEKH